MTSYFNNTVKFNLADDNNKGMIGKKVKKMKKSIKELDKKVTKGKSKDTDDKKRKRKRKPEDNKKSNLNAKWLKKKKVKLITRKIYLRFYHKCPCTKYT